MNLKNSFIMFNYVYETGNQDETDFSRHRKNVNTACKAALPLIFISVRRNLFMLYHSKILNDLADDRSIAILSVSTLTQNLKIIMGSDYIIIRPIKPSSLALFESQI